MISRPALLAFLFLLTQPLQAETYPCKHVSNYYCNFIPGCATDHNTSTCVGTIRKLPRFIEEFRKATRNTFSLESILGSDLLGLSLHHKSFAKVINKYGWKQEWILDFASFALDEHGGFNALEKKIKPFGISMQDLPNYPAAFALLYAEKELLALARTSNLQVSDLLKGEHEMLLTLATHPWAQENMKILGVDIKEVLKAKNGFALQESPRQIRELVDVLNLTPQQVLGLTQANSQLVYSASELGSCISNRVVDVDWLLTLDGMALSVFINSCSQLKNIVDSLGLKLSNLPTEYNSLSFLTRVSSDILSALTKELRLSLDFIARHKIDRTDIDAIKQSMSKFSISAEDAARTNPAWNAESLETINDLVKKTHAPLVDILNVGPYMFTLYPVIFELHNNTKLPFAAIVSNFLPYEDYPKEFADLYMLWKQDSSLSTPPFYSLISLSRDPQRTSQFLNDWKFYRMLTNFERFLEADVRSIEWQARILYIAISLGDLEIIKALPFVEDSGHLDYQGLGPAFVFAKKLGYEDIATYLRQYHSSVVRINTTDGETKPTCTVDNTSLINFRQHWHLRCNDFEPTNLIYSNHVGEFIETQIGFWQKTNLAHIPLSSTESVADALQDYKGSGYRNMAEFITQNATSSFPFLNRDAVKINGSNIAILLAPKSQHDITTYRGQGCQRDWVTTPNRFWSTSASAELARGWSQGNCVVEVQIPKGFPLFFLNIASMVNASEHEFLLPSHALNKDGQIVPTTYDILKEDAHKPFSSTDYDSEHDIEYEYYFSAHAFTVKPSDNFLTFANSGIQDFAAYQKHYTDLLCAAKNIDLKARLETTSPAFSLFHAFLPAPETLQQSFVSDNSYLKRMCDAAKLWQKD